MWGNKQAEKFQENLNIPRPEDFERKVSALVAGGADKLHVLSDFDRTLTTAFVDGEKRPSLISVLRDGNYLTPDYVAKAHALFDKYHPLEIDPALPLDEKKQAMAEWWSAHFELLIASGLNKTDVDAAIAADKVKLRPGAAEFLRLLNERGVPLVIMSSSGLGGEAIKAYLQRSDCLFANIHLVANEFVWDEQGRAVDYKKPVIHIFSKDETMLRDYDCFDEVKDRKNVLLLGDSTGDPGMVQGFAYDNLLKIGFLNEDEANSLAAYAEQYDALVLGDGPLNLPLDLLRKIK